jgi:hypothetical protein
LSVIEDAVGFRPTEQHVAFFRSFGFVKFPGLFAQDIGTLTEGFEDVFAEHQSWDTNVDLHFGEKRSIIPQVVTRSPKLEPLLGDDRVNSVVRALLGEPYEYAESDGNLFYCDTSWHSDIYAAPMEQPHLKLSFYLDPLDHETGAIRVIPGTNYLDSAFARRLRGDLIDPETVERTFGVAPQDIPSWTIESEPGDLVCWDFRTMHASFGGNARRRLFSVNFRRPMADTPADAEG